MLSYILCEDTKIGVNEQDISNLLEYFTASECCFRGVTKIGVKIKYDVFSSGPKQKSHYSCYIFIPWRFCRNKHLNIKHFGYSKIQKGTA